MWDDASDSLDRTVDAHVKTLRAKLKAVAPALEPIRTHRGVGYALAEDLPAAPPGMTKRNRVFAAILLAYAIGVGLLMWRLLADIDPRYRESAEESLVETAHLMAAQIEQRWRERRSSPSR